DAELVAGRAGSRALTATAPLAAAAAAPASPAPAEPLSVLVGRWNDRVRLDEIARAPGVTVAIVSGHDLVASTSTLGTLPSGPITGERTARFGKHTLETVGLDAPRIGATVLVATRPSAAADRGRLIVLFALLLVVLVILIVLVGHVVSGVVTGPVNTLVEAAQAVSRGDFDRHVDVAGDAEISALGRAFNQMTVDLREQVRQLEQSRNEFRTAIARLGDVLVSTHDIGGIIDVVLEAATLTTKGEAAVFFERVAMPARIRASAVHGVGSVPDLELNGTGIAGAAARRLGPVSFPGPDDLAPDEPPVTAAVAVPVVSDGRLFGVIGVYGRRNDSLFSEEDVHTLQTLARQAEVAIGNVMLHDETQRQARTDGTTGLWNRREFELRAREAVKESERFHDPFGVIVVDVDDFKRINDRWDHSTGDAALIWIASKLSEGTREIDVVARWGGEEFIVLLPRAGLDETHLVAERVRSVIAREPMVDGAVTIPITVSVGYAVQPFDGRTADDLFKAADAALLRAKRNGKNRVERAITDEGVPEMSEGSQS
ncbi:MAG TPA: diguanylate cyclase, partial [Acidimicrobiales bacterium]|nr:diguanylate cyclase [Acidimicrobiales bacterium]